MVKPLSIERPWKTQDEALSVKRINCLELRLSCHSSRKVLCVPLPKFLYCFLNIIGAF